MKSAKQVSDNSSLEDSKQEWSQLKKNSPGHLDPSLIERSLALSYEQRIDAHESALQLMRELQKAGQEFYARQSKGPA